MALVSREERKRLLLFVAAGTITSLVLIALWVALGGAAADPNVRETLMAGDTAAQRAVGERVARATTGPLIGAFQARVEARLRNDDPEAQAMTGPVSLRARNLRWLQPDGALFAQAASANAQVDLRAAAGDDILVSNAVLSDARVTLRQGADEWNYEVVLAELLDGDGASDDADNGRDRRVIVRDLRVANADVDVIRPGDRFSIDDIEATLPAIWFVDPAHANPTLSIARATATVLLGDTLPVAVVADDALVELSEQGTVFDVARLNLDGTQLADVEGTWNPEWSFPGLDARGRALDVSFVDVARFAPETFPEEGVASFTWEIEPLAAGRVEVRLTDLTASTEGSAVAGALAVRVGGAAPMHIRSADLHLDPLQLSLLERFAGPLPYDGRVRGTVTGTDGNIDFDVIAALHADEMPADSFTTAARGRLAMTDQGFELRSATLDLRAVPLASLRAFAPALPLGGHVSGTVALTGMPNRAPLDVDVRLETGGGIVTAEGVVDLTGDVPSYDVQGRIIGLDVQDVLQPSAPPLTLTGTFALAGSGVSPAEANARVRLDGAFTGWETTPGDSVRLVATLAGGTLQVETLAASVASLTVTADGEWRFVEPQSGAIRYALEVASLEPWGRYLPGGFAGAATGAFAATGTLTGPLAAVRLDGDVEGNSLSAGGWAFERVALTYEVELGDSLPRIAVTGSGTGIETPTAGSFESATLDARLLSPELFVSLRAERTGGAAVQLVADGIVPGTGERTIVLRQLEADVRGGRWTLLRPATFTIGDSAVVSVRDLELSEGVSGGRLFAQGVVWPIGRADARIEATELPVGDVQSLLGVEPLLTGMLDATADIRAGGGAPTIDLTFHVDSGAVRGVALNEFEGAVHFADGVIDARAVAMLDTAGVLTLAVRLPAELTVDSPSFRLLPEGAVTGMLETDNLALAPLVALDPRLRDVQGRISGQVQLAGTVETPEVAGQLTLWNGAVTVVPFGKRFTDIRGDLALDGRRIIVREVTATAQGTATARGEIVLDELTNPSAAIAVQLSAFRPVGVADREDAAFTGTLTLLGPLRASTLTGRVAINDGYLPIPAFGGPIDDFIDLPANDDVAETGSWFDALKVENLRVEIANDVWFIGEGAQAQLGGELAIEKIDDTFTLVGTLEGQRGTYTLQAGPIIRRFEIANAQVRFLGTPDINPAIDITARRTVLDQQGRQFEIDVRITGTLRTPRLSLASADLATLPESELLSFLFFGQGSANLNAQGNAGEVLLDQTLGSGLAEFAGLQLERALVHDLGLSFDLFQVRFGGPGGIGGFGAPTVVLGWELGSEFFLTVEGALAALAGGSTGTRESLWAIRLEWAFDPNSRARIGWEPVARNRYLRGFSLGLSPLQPENQFVFELRRRWTY